MDLGSMIALALSPSVIVLVAGICRATWVWLGESSDPRRADPRLGRIRI